LRLLEEGHCQHVREFGRNGTAVVVGRHALGCVDGGRVRDGLIALGFDNRRRRIVVVRFRLNFFRYFKRLLSREHLNLEVTRAQFVPQGFQRVPVALYGLDRLIVPGGLLLDGCEVVVGGGVLQRAVAKAFFGKGAEVRVGVCVLL
jgi:hypothetical protein